MSISNHTINSGIVRDVLAELAREGMAGKYFGGGLSAQFFLPQEFHRLTTDIDLESSTRTTSGIFHDYIHLISQPLVDRGYSVDFEKQRQTYDTILGRDGHQIVLQIPRRTTLKFEKEKKRIEREVANAEIVPYAGGKLRLINVNDLIAHKIGRADLFRRQYNLEIPQNTDLEVLLDRANAMKENLSFANLDPAGIEKKIAYVRMVCDLVDIRSIVANTKIDKKYLKNAMSESLTKDPKSMNEFCNLVVG